MFSSGLWNHCLLVNLSLCSSHITWTSKCWWHKQQFSSSFLLHCPASVGCLQTSQLPYSLVERKMCGHTWTGGGPVPMQWSCQHTAGSVTNFPCQYCLTSRALQTCFLYQSWLLFRYSSGINQTAKDRAVASVSAGRVCLFGSFTNPLNSHTVKLKGWNTKSFYRYRVLTLYF